MGKYPRYVVRLSYLVALSPRNCSIYKGSFEVLDVRRSRFSSNRTQ